ncbi:MAG: Uma2 family endonuclease [Armatimonadetes bacterium]|nr:Uma2 family endonuclease [Armatimonadota bacterium]
MSVQVRRWTRDEYYRLLEAGVLTEDDPVQLIQGEIVQMGPQGTVHATSTRLVAEALRTAFGPGFEVRTQLPLTLGTDSEPEPDAAVVTGGPRDYRDHHPRTALLVVEIADTTLEFDPTRKGLLYSGAGISEYWIVNLVQGSLEVYRDPQVAPEGQPGYRSRIVLDPSAEVTPLARPSARIRVSDLLP